MARYGQPTIADLLIATLFSTRNVRSFNRILREREFKRYKKESIQVTLSRLRKRNYVCHSPSGWSLTQEGRCYFEENKLSSYLPSPFKKNSPHTTIISFDIPEVDRKTRNWLRNQIKIFGYTMLQQSLWTGPGPLPFQFLERLIKLGIRENIKIFSRVKKLS